MKARQPRWLGPAAAGSATALFFWKLVLGARVLGARDVLRVYYPVRAAWAQRLAEGHFPEWYGADGLGQSFVGMTVSGAFHPSNLLFLVLPLEAAMTLGVLLAFVAAFCGAFALARRFTDALAPALLAGVLFAFNGYQASLTNNLAYLFAAAALPWVAWAADRLCEAPSVQRAGALAGLLWLVLTAGDPQTFVVAAGLTPLSLALRPGPRGRQAAALLGALALAGLWGAVQILPSLGAVGDSVMAQQTAASALTWSTHPVRWLELAFGAFFTGEPSTPMARDLSRQLLDTDQDQLWADSLFLGLPAVVLAVAGAVQHRTRAGVRWALGALALVAVLAMGKHAGLYRLVRELVPLFKSFRYPEKLVPFVMLALAALAAAGLSSLEGQGAARRRVAAVLGSLGLVAAAGALAAGTVASTLFTAVWHGAAPSAAVAAQLEAGLSAALWPTALLSLVGAVVLWPAAVPGRALVLVSLSAAGLWLGNQAAVHLMDPAVLHEAPRLVQLVKERSGGVLPGPRVLGASDAYAVPKLKGAEYRDVYARAVASALEPVTPTLFGLEGANAYLPAAPRRVRLLGDRVPQCPTCAAALGVGFVAFSTAVHPLSPWQQAAVVEQDPTFKLALVAPPGAGTRLFVTDRRCVAGPDEAVGAVMAPTFTLEGATVVECPPQPAAPNEEEPAGDARFVIYEPERVELAATARRPAVVVLNDAFAAGWSATVDGAPAELLRANGVARAVALPAGQHQVVFTYRTPGLRSGFALALLALLGFAAALVLERRRSGTPALARPG
ncbi:MAG: YfhO family protein [Myxococcaceae bacterium]|nr:YfhO family protein [Myxococcaceae bacterium]